MLLSEVMKHAGHVFIHSYVASGEGSLSAVETLWPVMEITDSSNIPALLSCDVSSSASPSWLLGFSFDTDESNEQEWSVITAEKSTESESN